MKIGLFCPYNIAKDGGVREIVMAIKDELAKRGHEVKIITPLPRGNDMPDMPDVLFIGASVDYKSPMRTTAQVSMSGDIEKIDAILAQEKFDIIHFHEPWIPVLSRQILQRSTSVNVATFHSQIPETIVSRTVIKVVTPYLKSVMKYIDVMTSVSDAGAEYAASITKQPITIIPNGVDLTKYRIASGVKKSKTKPKTILYIGRLEGRKGVKYLLKAYQILEQKHENVRLLIAGNGPDREKLELLAEDLKLQNVSFLGYISEAHKLELLAEADLFCSPAIYGESFGIVLLEAMATGAVVVAGDNAGYQEVMQGVGSISLVNPQQTVDFARRLDMLLHEEPLRAAWKAWAREYVQQFSYPKMVDGYEKVYKQALKEHGHKKTHA